MKRIGAMLIAVFMMVTMVACKKTNKISMKSNFDKGDEDFTAELCLSSMTKIAENDSFELLIDGSTTEITVRNKKNGYVWNTQSKCMDNASENFDGNIYSPLEFMFVDKSQRQYTSSAYVDAIKNNQFSFSKIQNGVRVNYLLGEPVKNYATPTVVSEKRMNEICSALDESDKQSLLMYYRRYSLSEMSDTDKAVYLEKYPILKKHNIYALNGITLGNQTIPDFLLETLQEYFLKAGYSYEKLKEDNIDNLVKDEQKDDHSISVSIEYTLENAGLSVRVPINSLKFDSDIITLTEMSLLPFFGASGKEDNGYLFVPDGCGALINLNSKKQSVNAYEKHIYGSDSTLNDKKKTDSSSVIHLPVFGEKVNDKAFLAIVESAGANADICAQVSGKDVDYNQIYTKYRLCETMTQAESLVNVSGNKIFSDMFDYDIKVKYLFFDNESANYSSMANAYGEYLEDNHYFAKREKEDELPVFISAIGGVPYRKNVCGFPVDSVKSLTSYSQLRYMLGKYISENIKNIKVGYIGWSKNSIYGTENKNASFSAALGKNKELSELFNYINNNSISFFSQIDFTVANNCNGIKATKNASRKLSNMIAYKYDYSLATLENKNNDKSTVLSPFIYENLADDFLKSYKKSPKSGIWFNSFGTCLNSDYNEKRPVFRQNAEKLIQKTEKKFLDNNIKIAVSGANIYSLNGVSLVTDVPIFSSGDYIFDQEVPFYQIVLHGRVDYVSSALNMSSDYKTDVLKLLETGTAPAFKFIYEKNIELKDVDSSFYSANFDMWYEQSISIYKTLNDAYGICNSAFIKEHKKIDDKVYCTVYDNGISVYINYSNKKFALNGVSVEPMNYKIVRGS